MSGGVCGVSFSQDGIDRTAVDAHSISDTVVNKNGIEVEYAHSYSLDDFTTSWGLDSAQVIRYVQTRRKIDADQAREIINKNYHPFSLKTLILNNESEEYLVITPSGVGISRNIKIKEYEFYMTDDSSFILPPQEYNRNWRVKILSKLKYCSDAVSANEESDLYRWFEKWELTATQMNEYFDMCEWIGSYRLNGFGNIPCQFVGFALFQNKLYYYRLECSGGTSFRELNGVPDDEQAGFGCYDERGTKYIYEIHLSSDE